MPALAADIAAGIRPARIETWSDTAIKDRYPSALDGSQEPAEGFCDDPSHAFATLSGRAALFGTERRRFVVKVTDLLWPDPAAAIPIIALVDDEQQANGNHLPARIELSLEAETTDYEVFG